MLIQIRLSSKVFNCCNLTCKVMPISIKKSHIVHFLIRTLIGRHFLCRALGQASSKPGHVPPSL